MKIGRTLSRVRAPMQSDRGFVLLLVLALTAVIAVSAISLLQIGRRDRTLIAAAVSSTRANLVLDAALNRASQALADPTDEMRLSLLAGSTPVIWKFADTEIFIEAVAESGKIDVNASDPELRQAGFRLARAAGIKIENLSASGQQPSVDALLSPCDRTSSQADRLREIFTVYTKQTGLTVHLASPLLLEGLGVFSPTEINAIHEHREDPNTLYRGSYLETKARAISHGPPIYTIRATMKDREIAQIFKENVVLLSDKPPHVRTIEVRTGNTAEQSLCD